MCDNDAAAIVVDHGSETIKAGFAGNDQPTIIFPTIVGRLQHSLMDSVTQKIYIGDEVLPVRDQVTVTYPIESTIIINWENMKLIWEYIFFKKLKIDCCTCPIILTEPAMVPSTGREKIVQIFFEHFTVPALYLAKQQVNSLYASGRTTGIVLDCGSCCLSPVPIYEGRVLKHNISRPMPLGGRDLDDLMVNMLIKRGYSFSDSIRYKIAKDIKEKLCYVALDFEQEMDKAKTSSSLIEKKHQLPDGKIITIEDELFRCPEKMFQPIEWELPGIHEWTYNSIMRCDTHIRNDLFNNFVLAGGTTLFPGFDQRLKKEMNSLVQSAMNVNIIAPSNREYSSWIGASMLASLSTFQQMYISQQEYNEYGPSIVHRKCF